MPIEPAELAALIDSRWAFLRAWAARRCADPEGVVQEAFCRLAAQAEVPARPVAWLFRVVGNLAAHDSLAQRRRRRREERVSLDEGYSRDPAADLLAAEAWAAIDTLDATSRDVVLARLGGQLAWDEVAELCNTSPATALRRYRAALEQLRTTLEKPCTNRPT